MSSLTSTLISQRGGKVLVVDGFSFNYHKNMKNSSDRWRCNNRRCKAYLHTTMNGRVITFSNLDHNHASTTNPGRQRLQGLVKQIAQSNLFERPNVLVNRVLKKTQQADIDNSDINCTKRVIYYARRKVIPAIPRNIMEDSSCSQHDKIRSLCIASMTVTEKAPSQDYCLDFCEIFKEEELLSTGRFKHKNEVRKDLYLELSNSKNLSQICKRLLTNFDSNITTNLIPLSLDLDLLTITKDDLIPEGTSKEIKLQPFQFIKFNPPLFTELRFAATKSEMNTTTTSFCDNKAIGHQHIIFTTQPGSISSSDSSGDLHGSDSSSSSSNNSQKRRKPRQKAGDFVLGDHGYNSSFHSSVKCCVEILILIVNPDYCKKLAQHMGMIFFDDLLEGESNIESRLLNEESKMYRVAHTKIIKLMMNGYSSICFTASVQAWRNVSASVKAIIATDTQLLELKQSSEIANFVLQVEDNLLTFIEAISQIVKASLYYNVLLEVKYQVDEKSFSKVNLPLTVLIPLYIVKYYTQKYIATKMLENNSTAESLFAEKKMK